MVKGNQKAIRIAETENRLFMTTYIGWDCNEAFSPETFLYNQS